jgi:hypothetical protein
MHPQWHVDAMFLTCTEVTEHEFLGEDSMRHTQSYKTMRGLTIIQTMLILLVVGIVGSVVLNYLVDKRCTKNPSLEMCATRK